MSNVSTGQEAEITADLPRERSQFKELLRLRSFQEAGAGRGQAADRATPAMSS